MTSSRPSTSTSKHQHQHHLRSENPHLSKSNHSSFISQWFKERSCCYDNAKKTTDALINVRDLQGRDSLIRRCHLSERDNMKEYSFENKIFFMLSLISDFCTRHWNQSPQCERKWGTRWWSSFFSNNALLPMGKGKHHLSNNFSHPDYLPESLLFWTIHRLQLLLIPGVVLLLVVCVSFKLSWQEDHVARINLSIVSTSPNTVVDPLIFSKSTIKQIWLKISCSSFF